LAQLVNDLHVKCKEYYELALQTSVSNLPPDDTVHLSLVLKNCFYYAHLLQDTKSAIEIATKFLQALPDQELKSDEAKLLLQ
jgi:hypothetical protein